AAGNRLCGGDLCAVPPRGPERHPRRLRAGPYGAGLSLRGDPDRQFAGRLRQVDRGCRSPLRRLAPAGEAEDHAAGHPHRTFLGRRIRLPDFLGRGGGGDLHGQPRPADPAGTHLGGAQAGSDAGDRGCLHHSRGLHIARDGCCGAFEETDFEMTPAFLSIRSLRQTYGSVVAVDDVSLEIPEGEFLTFLGPSGSGKSTTLYALAGFNEPTSGDILLRGGSILATPSHKRNIGMVFQRYTLFPHLNVRENVGFPLRVRGRPEREVARRVDTMLALVRLDGYGDRMPGHLSGGQQQRVALARALAYDPPVLLMDEPLSALDKKLREEIQIEIRRIHRETGVTILYVTHDQEEALRLSDRIAVFNRGRIEQVGSGRDLYHN